MITWFRTSEGRDLDALASNNRILKFPPSHEWLMNRVKLPCPIRAKSLQISDLQSESQLSIKRPVKQGMQVVSQDWAYRQWMALISRDE